MPQIIVTCPPGFEYLLVDELKSLGADSANEGLTQVIVEADWPEIYRICLWSRLANRVLFPITEFDCANEDQLYEQCVNVPWDIHFSVDQTFAVDFVSRRSFIKHQQFGALKIKDAIVDYFREAYSDRPSVETDTPDVRIHCRVNKNRASLCIDLSGKGLHQRGYREKAGEAPLKENLAAALLYRADWPNKLQQSAWFFDPMCGSGTLVIEAAMMALDKAPGLQRTYWGFTGWKRHQADLWESEHSLAQQRYQQAKDSTQVELYGNDLDQQVLEIARNNASIAGVSEYIAWSCGSFERSERPESDFSGVIVTNPPYGERLEQRARVSRIYQALGQWLKAKFVGDSALVLSTDKEHGHALGIRATKIYRLMNGPIQCELLKLELQPENFVEPRGKVTAENYQETLSTHAQALNNRIKKNLASLKSFLKQQQVSCYRLYDAEIPEYAAAIDIYDNSVHIQEYAPPKTVDASKARRRLRDIETVVSGLLDVPAERIFVKTRTRQKGEQQYTRQSTQQAVHIVSENQAKFEVNLSDYLDTGLFLDHRKARQMLAAWSRPGTQLLNLFCYTGTASVQAALAGATTTNVDLSNTYLKWAERNFELNKLDTRKHVFERDDCMAWLDKAITAGMTFDLIFIDPPTFSNSKRLDGHFDIQEQHSVLLEKACRLLSPSGKLLFSNNFKKFKMMFKPDESFSMRETTRETTSRDFVRKPLHRSWLIEPKN
ncbi:bifunctional 23S rRNA (guanine(2069)-N(7))-methyltransferase RlmK/23S rRNA (guanine(2445)-N(2))-methyltransferase RlmL [Pleionea litopenaei]|uniref:Ribosomal RNA large subunit methyltransferase K/L n=1 Tax=Pleionea litopenaei TaxID=3070815 RepID=A0AA51RVP6_9GAMM|nr:bifunctional 23S rRNA (guanine(2069)-N(7))-methyltransferase RlmK/23S rRNA (guanine(2445)-N(2))-methyltransferase RlmL [Pleionea sp. HL-JVS1]WMS88452.1 bifunctional 23S rRNA (guanine(2069)-N(7))-methyltransferase RlmK/23S rRNA (guanine(2445)-N(2))-methyltransferase RlmL [Pleionea sp. HL-JVS1]